MKRIEQAGVPWLARGWVPQPRKVVGEPMMTYDFPLRQDLLVRCTLPKHLTTDDAKRIGEFVQAVAFR